MKQLLFVLGLLLMSSFAVGQSGQAGTPAPAQGEAPRAQAGGAPSQNAAHAGKTSTTVPITFDHNRVIIDVRFRLPDGTMKRVRAWVNNGNAQMWITGDLAKKLKLTLAGDLRETPFGKEIGASVPPSLVIGGMEIPLKLKKLAAVDRETIAPGSSAEVSLPSTVLRDYDVIVNYPDRELSIGLPGTLHFTGTAAKDSINPQTGTAQLPANVAGEKTSLALDMGSCFSMLIPDLSDRLVQAHPQWPHMMGGVDAANVWGLPEEATWQVLRVPSLQFGGENLADVGFATLPQGVADWFTKRPGIAMSGLIGGNALLDFRVGLDYAHSTVYLERVSKMAAPEMNVVGLTLRPEPDETYTIIGVPDYNGKPAVTEVKAGDVLVSVDKTPAKGGTMGQVWSLLSGSPGDTRVLVVRRDGKEMTVNAPVQGFLSTPSH
ncbi:MAG: hypothetical protein H0X25_21700 [Acidobacteriales bacterium]|nr:hypothetical protein [Terriglobales bacterium]